MFKLLFKDDSITVILFELPPTTTMKNFKLPRRSAARTINKNTFELDPLKLHDIFDKGIKTHVSIVRFLKTNLNNLHHRTDEEIQRMIEAELNVIVPLKVVQHRLQEFNRRERARRTIMRPSQIKQQSISESDMEKYEKFDNTVYHALQDDIASVQAPHMAIYTSDEEEVRQPRQEHVNLFPPRRTVSEPNQNYLQEPIPSQDPDVLIIPNGIQAPTFKFKNQARRTDSISPARQNNEIINQSTITKWIDSLATNVLNLKAQV